jgi:hypothetical protein|tara:strand:- start:2894 stop:3130 length:237 start_codon:yes stop_codon:yes gene_type:complete
MNNKDRTAIENLIIIARYMQDNSVLSAKDEKLLEHSICRAQTLIGIEVEAQEIPVELGDIAEFDVNSLVEALKKRKKS